MSLSLSCYLQGLGRDGCRPERGRSSLGALLPGLKLGCTGLKLPITISSIIPRESRFSPGWGRRARLEESRWGKARVLEWLAIAFSVDSLTDSMEMN